MNKQNQELAYVPVYCAHIRMSEIRSKCIHTCMCFSSITPMSMSMSVPMYHAHAGMYVFACPHGCQYTRLCVCLYYITCLSVYAYIIPMCTCWCVYLCVPTCVHAYVHTYIYISLCLDPHQCEHLYLYVSLLQLYLSHNCEGSFLHMCIHFAHEAMCTPK